MLHEPLLIPPSPVFWDEVARVLCGEAWPVSVPAAATVSGDMSGMRVAVPTFQHAQRLKAALAKRCGAAFIPPRIGTLTGWCAMLPPEPEAPAAAGERLMTLYAELRQHAWLKKLFSARRNTDLLPLAQMLLTLSDELTLGLLPEILSDADAAQLRWQKALEQLSPTARHTISDETQLVWSIWKTQLDQRDPLAAHLRRMLQLAQSADETLVWVAPETPSPFEQAFLSAYGERQLVLPILLDWNAGAVAPQLAAAWPELLEQGGLLDVADEALQPELKGIALRPCGSMEQEAQLGAQTVVDWLLAGKSSIAVVAQDRVAARRLRALLERAKVVVTDETGWKLSTTRAASAIAAWFDVVATRGDTTALLDLLKSPFAFAAREDKEALLIAIEAGLRKANVLGGWDAAIDAMIAHVPACELLRGIAQRAAPFGGRKTIAQWYALTESALTALGIWPALQQDAAGGQVAALLQRIALECGGPAQLESPAQPFSLAEWRALVGLQLESTSYLAPGEDRRVVMLPLNGTPLRFFDAVLVLGCDAEHLPSSAGETLFFANAVRRELGLSTQESRQRRQLRDVAALLQCHGEVVLSWQTHKDGEPNPLSPWLERLQLTLQRAAIADEYAGLPTHPVAIAAQKLTAVSAAMPTPAAPHLLPEKLSASGYNSLVACPYQFFATRMLGLSGLDELSDMPEKRDYGDWLHRILNRYHEQVRDQELPLDEEARTTLLRSISAGIFEREVSNNAAALGYYTRWLKALPAYLTWANEREAEGWRFAFGEKKFEKALTWEDGGITLQGRLDRVDVSDTGVNAILDYKTKNAISLREKLKQGEDRQLAFYGILSGLPAEHAHYVALEPDNGKIADVEASDYAERQRVLEQQLGATMQAVACGAPLPANGIEAVCSYCAVRGLCRKGAW